MKPRSFYLPMLIAALLLCGGSAEAYTFYRAAVKNYLSWSAKSTSGYNEVEIDITVKASVDIVVDFSSCWLVAADGSQRIGLAYEKSTGSYNLRLRAKQSYTLLFQSRCLDHNRPGPTTGTYFKKLYQIDTNAFWEIVNALRQNYTQGSVWFLTDQNGDFSIWWKYADPRSHNGGRPSLDLSGAVSWATSGNLIDIRAGKVTNRRSSGRSGSLRLRIWATTLPYVGGGIYGYVLGTRNLDPLNAGYYYSNIYGYVTYSPPPHGYYYTTITLEEYTSSGWVISDYIDFSGTTYL
ncbi:MAG TPA: hypothetical protein VFD27_17700 [Chthoniobacteraceae bacterium]|nr:hypothetical protein [Chthoniobacteraceae bacterium]